ncbi:hypothetical protein [Spiroplasma poulsonii]|uniref:hypothetical protein n=1 Tax=Spiroplasma poulsonii TaxID=2138 RepID=UPI001F4CA25E|nr:hypothetical protein [Spiroplasma poulsonii]UNF62166.1 hypothetical protein MNU24_01495 [Spiroplasma poulsonii]
MFQKKKFCNSNNWKLVGTGRIGFGTAKLMTWMGAKVLGQDIYESDERNFNLYLI